MAHPADVNPDGFTQISGGGRNHVGERQRTGELLTRVPEEVHGDF